MDTKDKAIFSIGIFIEVVGMGLGVIDNIPDWIGWALIILSIPLLGYAAYRLFTYKPEYASWQEVKARGEAKKYYLKPLQSNITSIINLYQELAGKAYTLPLNEYDKKYFRTKYKENDKHYNWQILKRIEGIPFWNALMIQLGLSFISNNPYYAELKNTEISKNLQQEYRELYSEIADRRLKKLLHKLWDKEHKYFSYYIYYEIRRINFNEKPFVSNYINNQKEKIQNEYTEIFNAVTTRIKELAGGYPDER